jgi:hypothetical protein
LENNVLTVVVGRCIVNPLQLLKYTILSIWIILMVSGCQRLDTLGDTILDLVDGLSGIGDAISELLESITRSIGEMQLALCLLSEAYDAFFSATS